MKTLIRIATMLLVLAAGTRVAGADAPETAVCRACDVRGAAHGEEKVVASREHEGKTYHFCSEQCGEAFDAFPAAYALHPIPRPAPSIVVTTTDDRNVALGVPGGDAILLDFWATWCVPCREAMPELEALQREYGAKGLTVLGVSIDEEAGAVGTFLGKTPLGYTVAIDSTEQPAWHAFAVAAIPAMYLIDGEGQIVGEWKGKVEMDDVRRRVEALMSEASPQ